jgi:hypothetical protein
MVYDLAAGQTGQITVVAELNDRYDAGTQLPNEVWISSDTTLVNTGDDYAIVVPTVESRQDVRVVVDAINLTHTANDWNQDPTWAVSGDLIQFTISYQNSGNVTLDATLLNLLFPPHAYGFNSSYERHIGTLPFGSGGSFVVTGIVGPQGFNPIVAVGNIYAQQFGIQAADTDTATVIEKPMRCGDGFITHDEMCDFENGQTL